MSCKSSLFVTFDLAKQKIVITRPDGGLEVLEVSEYRQLNPETVRVKPSNVRCLEILRACKAQKIPGFINTWDILGVVKD